MKKNVSSSSEYGAFSRRKQFSKHRGVIWDFSIVFKTGQLLGQGMEKHFRQREQMEWTSGMSEYGTFKNHPQMGTDTEGESGVR